MERVSPYRMREGLKDWLPHYKECPAHLRMQLLKMSGVTLGRYIGEIRETLAVKRGISTTAPARFMKNKIPIEYPAAESVGEFNGIKNSKIKAKRLAGSS